MTSIFAFNAFPARADLVYAHEERIADDKNAEKCSGLGDGLHILEESIACFSGTIEIDNANDVAENLLRGDIDKIYISSSGGSTKGAMIIGRALYKSEAKLVVYDVCFSSCANYIAPAAYIVTVKKGAVIGLHGSMPRSVVSYLDTIADLEIHPAGSSQRIEAIGRAIKEYPNTYKEITILESLYFVDIGISEQYVTRYFEIDRNRRMYDNKSCGQIPPVAIVLGPEYFKEFYMGNLLAFEWDIDSVSNNEFYDNLSQEFSIVVDNALFPSHIPGIGDKAASECFDLEIF